jgi:hypothetical protein
MPKQTIANFENGLILLDINTQGSNVTTFQITNNVPDKSAQFNLLDSVDNSIVIWSVTVPPSTVGALTPIPTVDNFGHPITFVIGQQTSHGITKTGLISPPWNFLTV